MGKAALMFLTFFSKILIFLYIRIYANVLTFGYKIDDKWEAGQWPSS